MKLLSFTLLALCIIGGVSAQLFTCPTTKCAKATEVCGPTANNTYTGCGADSYCTNGGSLTTLGVCVVPFRLGDVCSAATSNCESGTYCKTADRSSDNSVCALSSLPVTYLYAGEGCSDDKQCATSSPYGADDNYDRCRSGKCRSFKTGDYCTSSRGQCNYNNAYCGRTNQCTKYISKGGPCYFSDESVLNGGCGKDYDSTCIPNGLDGDAGTCQKLHSRKAGEYCKDYDDCKEGLFCRIRDGSSRGICSEIAETLTINRPCNSNADCTADNTEQCRCGADGNLKCFPEVRPDGYHSAYKNYKECTRKKGCDSAGSAGFLGCVMDKCKSQYCKYNKVMGKRPYASVSCQYEGICNSAFSLVASPVLALLAFIVVMAL